MKIKVNDKVMVLSGKNKGKTGTVMRVFSDTRRVTVEKVNLRTKHIKKTATSPGQRLTYEAPVDVSKVILVCPHCKKPTRVAHKVPKTGKKFRACAKCGESLEQNVTAKAEGKKKKI